ncbi:MAG: hypothetical protein WAQ52_14210 [Terriglobales bacterium]
MACPYFVPREIVNDGSWLHPSRLPLGAGWSGRCCASGQEVTPADSALREFCNLGNATACPHLPRERDWDAIRFSVALTSAEQITLWYVCELAHAPIEHGKLTFDRVQERWLNPHADSRVQRLAGCYLETCRSRRNVGTVVESLGA